MPLFSEHTIEVRVCVFSWWYVEVPEAFGVLSYSDTVSMVLLSLSYQYLETPQLKPRAEQNQLNIQPQVQDQISELLITCHERRDYLSVTQVPLWQQFSTCGPQPPPPHVTYQVSYISNIYITTHNGSRITVMKKR